VSEQFHSLRLHGRQTSGIQHEIITSAKFLCPLLDIVCHLFCSVPPSQTIPMKLGKLEF